VDERGEERLADAGLAEQEHRRPPPRDALRRRVDLPHRRVGDDEARGGRRDDGSQRSDLEDVAGAEAALSIVDGLAADRRPVPAPEITEMDAGARAPDDGVTT
jgi:hypothetical protein